MSFQYDTLHITHQLTTGIGYPYCFGLDEKIIRGSVYLDGPTIIGDENWKAIRFIFLISN